MSTDRDYLAAGLAVGGLSDAELAEAEALATTDSDFRAEVAAYSESLSLLATSDEPQAVSTATRDSILAIPSTHGQRPGQRRESTIPEQGNHAHPAPTPADLAERRRRRSPALILAAAAAVIAIAGFGLTTWQMQQRQSELEENLATTQEQLNDTRRLMEAPDLRTSTAQLPGGGSVTVVSSAREQLIHVSPHEIEVEPDSSLQMWVIGAHGPESAGLMTDRPLNIDDHGFTEDSLFGITVEPEGGSPQPTTEPVVAIDL